MFSQPAERSGGATVSAAFPSSHFAGSCPCVVIVGPTATGKTRLAVALARCFGGEIVSADSRQVYRGLTIGSGKDLAEYSSGGEPVPYHLVDVVSPAEEYHLFRFLADAREAICRILERGRLPMIAGGTSLYVNALLDDYSLEGGEPEPALRAALSGHSTPELCRMLLAEAPDVYARTDLSQRKRVVRGIEIARTRGGRATVGGIRLSPLILGPYYPRAAVHERIGVRLEERLEEGLVEEVARLHREGLSWERLDGFGLEYRHVAAHLRGFLSYERMKETLLARIRRLCRAQDIWFRKMERAGKVIHWIPGGDPAEAGRLVSCFLAGEELPPPRIRLMDIDYGRKKSSKGG